MMGTGELCFKPREALINGMHCATERFWPRVASVRPPCSRPTQGRAEGRHAGAREEGPRLRGSDRAGVCEARGWRAHPAPGSDPSRGARWKPPPPSAGALPSARPCVGRLHGGLTDASLGQNRSVAQCIPLIRASLVSWLGCERCPPVCQKLLALRGQRAGVSRRLARGDPVARQVLVRQRLEVLGQ